MKKWKTILRFTAMALLIFAFVFLTVSGIRKQNQQVCKKIDIEINYDKDKNFLEPSDILRRIDNDSASVLVGKSFSSLDLQQLESQVRNTTYVQDAKVYADPSGKLVVKVQQKQPILRIINMQAVSYYLTDNKEIIPVSDKFTPRVLVAAGDFGLDAAQQSQVFDDLYRMDSFIRSDAFWLAMVDQLYVVGPGQYEILTKAAQHTVVLGNADMLQDKFRRLEIFYKECYGRVDWDQYEKIDLSYRGQIVAKKKQTE